MSRLDLELYSFGLLPALAALLRSALVFRRSRWASLHSGHTDKPVRADWGAETGTGG